MTRRKVLMPAAVFVLVAQLLLVAGIIHSTYAISGPGPPPIAVDLHLDLDTAKGFEKVRMLDRPFSGTPEFVLRRGDTGTFNITLASSETNKTVVAALSYGGWRGRNIIPDGITYRIEPSNMTLAPKSKTTAIMRISAVPGTAIRGYNLSIYLSLGYAIYGVYSEERGYSTVLTIVEGTSPPINTTSTTKSTASYVTQTATLTSTTTTTATILIERAAEPSIYAWAVGATAITAVLAVVLLRRRS